LARKKARLSIIKRDEYDREGKFISFRKGKCTGQTKGVKLFGELAQNHGPGENLRQIEKKTKKQKFLQGTAFMSGKEIGRRKCQPQMGREASLNQGGKMPSGKV